MSDRYRVSSQESTIDETRTRKEIRADARDHSNIREEGRVPRVPVDKLLVLADVLGVKLDDLVAVYDGASLTTEDRPVRYSTINSPRNVINNYRIRKNLRFDELAQILGLADGECARVVCRRETARNKHICRISRLEGMTPDEFVMRYSNPT